MKIVVAIKQVPVRDSDLRLAPSGHWIEEAGLSFEINEPDAYAFEEAMQLKERCGGEVTVVSLGPERAAQAIRETLAKGADHGIHVELEDASSLDALAAARILADAIGPESPDLILTGLQSEDYGQGETGVMLAELLGLPHATIVMNVEVLDGAVRVRRELEDGWSQTLELPLPALLTIQSGIHQLRYATLMGIKKARSKRVRSLPAADPAAAGRVPAGAAAIERIYVPPRCKQARLFKGDPRAAAAGLVEALRFEARVL